MFEVIPNWHPVFVHFTVALLSLSSLLFLVGVLAPSNASWKKSSLTVARWNLWIGAFFYSSNSYCWLGCLQYSNTRYPIS